MKEDVFDAVDVSELIVFEKDALMEEVLVIVAVIEKGALTNGAGANASVPAETVVFQMTA